MPTFLSALKTNQNLQKHLTHDCTFCILCRLNFNQCCYCDRNYLFLSRENLGLGLGNFFSLENSWNFVDNFHLFYKQTKTCRSIWLMIILFVFYVDSISINAATLLAEITWYCFVFSRENLGLAPGKRNSLPWKTPGNMIISKQHDSTVQSFSGENSISWQKSNGQLFSLSPSTNALTHCNFVQVPFNSLAWFYYLQYFNTYSILHFCFIPLQPILPLSCAFFRFCSGMNFDIRLHKSGVRSCNGMYRLTLFAWQFILSFKPKSYSCVFIHNYKWYANETEHWEQWSLTLSACNEVNQENKVLSEPGR